MNGIMITFNNSESGQKGQRILPLPYHVESIVRVSTNILHDVSVIDQIYDHDIDFLKGLWSFVDQDSKKRLDRIIQKLERSWLPKQTEVVR